ncbi:MAG: hypothetical protein QM752_05715 [Gammaproteobacteria bacterium]
MSTETKPTETKAPAYSPASSYSAAPFEAVMGMIKTPYRSGPADKTRQLIEKRLGDKKGWQAIEILHALMQDSECEFSLDRTAGTIYFLKQQLKTRECLDRTWEAVREVPKLDFKLRVAGDLIIEDNIKAFEKSCEQRITQIELNDLTKLLKKQTFPSDPITQRKLCHSLQKVMRPLVTHQAVTKKNLFGQTLKQEFTWPERRKQCDPILRNAGDFSYYQYLVAETAKKPKDSYLQEALMQAREWVDLNPVPLTPQQRQEELLKFYITLKEDTEPSPGLSGRFIKTIENSIVGLELDQPFNIRSVAMDFYLIGCGILSIKDFLFGTLSSNLDHSRLRVLSKLLSNWMIDDSQLMVKSHREEKRD